MLSFVTKKFECRNSGWRTCAHKRSQDTRCAAHCAHLCGKIDIVMNADGHVDSSLDATIDLTECILELSGTESKEQMQNLRMMILA